MASASGVLNLFVQGEVANSLQGEPLPLFAFGSAGSGQYAGLYLYAHCQLGFGNVSSGVLPLHALGVAQGTQSGNLPLFAEGAAYTSQNSLLLYALNNSAYGQLNLWASGEGQTAGGLTTTGVLPLYIGRATAACLDLYVMGPAYSVGSGLNLYSLGGLVGSGNLPLVAPNVVGRVGEALTLFGRGF